LLERLELDVFRPLSLVSKGPVDFVEIVCSHGSKLPAKADILMKLVLKIDK
jgi:hypothetical protein